MIGHMKNKFYRARVNQTPTEAAGDLALRVFAGLSMALAHGLGKLPPSDQFIQGVTGLGFPLPVVFAWLASFAEVGGGILLAAGLITRPAAFFVAFTMAVAAFHVHADDPFQRKEMALLYFFIALYYVLAGAGRYSLDAFCCKKK